MKQTMKLQCYEAKPWTIQFQQFIIQMSVTSKCTFFFSSLELFQFVDIIKKSVTRSCLFGAVQVTLARLDQHHHPADDLPVPASELDGWRLGSVRPAASPV